MGHVVIQIGYGEKIWNELGKKSIDLNMKAVAIFADSANVFWMVNMIPSCKDNCTTRNPSRAHFLF
jgi:hypothetical protein